MTTNTSSRTQAERADQTRARILDAAVSEFSANGLAGARTEQIAEAAGVNKALLYYYFKSKARLYEAVIERHLQEFNQRALALLNSPGPARTLLLRYVELHFDFISRRHRHAPLFQQLMMKGGGPPERLFRKYILPRAQALGKLLERGMKAGELRKVDPYHTTLSLAALVVFYFSAAPMLRRTGSPDPYAAANLKRRKREVLDFIRHGLFVDPTHP